LYFKHIEESLCEYGVALEWLTKLFEMPWSNSFLTVIWV
jgi:hypothetical protein